MCYCYISFDQLENFDHDFVSKHMKLDINQDRNNAFVPCGISKLVIYIQLCTYMYLKIFSYLCNRLLIGK